MSLWNAQNYLLERFGRDRVVRRFPKFSHPQWDDSFEIFRTAVNLLKLYITYLKVRENGLRASFILFINHQISWLTVESFAK